MVIKVNHIDGDSDERMTIELEEKVVSLEDRLEREVVNNKKLSKATQNNNANNNRVYYSPPAAVKPQ